MTRCVLLSGGMDSAMALHWALEQGPAFAVAVDYGQRHRVELVAARRIAQHARVELVEVAASLPWQSSSLTGGGSSPVVPGRNMVLCSLAAAEAQARGAESVVIACVADDHAVFPDCRPAFLDALANAIHLAMGIHVEAPFATKTKRDAFAEASGRAREAVALSWSCYDPQPAGARGPVSCGVCGACVARARALREAA